MNPSITLDATTEIASRLNDYLDNQRIDVPMLPTVASRVMQMSLNRETDARQLSTLIQSDQALAAHIMKIANSPMYTPNGTLVSLQQAISRLGMRMIGEIAISVSFRSKMFDAEEYQNEIAQLKRHAFATALWSKEIARSCRRNVEAIFLCGLLHSIGNPAAIQKIAEISQVVDHEISKEACLEMARHYHSRFGKQIVEQWNMPGRVAEVILGFDSYLETEESCEMTAIVVTGSKFADFTLGGDSDPAKLGELRTLDEINLYPDQVEDLLEKNQEMAESIEAMIE